MSEPDWKSRAQIAEKQLAEAVELVRSAFLNGRLSATEQSQASQLLAQHQSPQSSEPPPFRLFDRVKRRGQVGDALGSVMAMQQFDHGWEVWVHVAAYGSNSVIKADGLIFVSHKPANLELTAEGKSDG